MCSWHCARERGRQWERERDAVSECACNRSMVTLKCNSMREFVCLCVCVCVCVCVGWRVCYRCGIATATNYNAIICNAPTSNPNTTHTTPPDPPPTAPSCLAPSRSHPFGAVKSHFACINYCAFLSCVVQFCLFFS